MLSLASCLLFVSLVSYNYTLYHHSRLLLVWQSHNQLIRPSSLDLSMSKPLESERNVRGRKKMIKAAMMAASLSTDINPSSPGIASRSVQPGLPSEGRNSATSGPAPRRKASKRSSQTTSSPNSSVHTEDNTSLSSTRETEDHELSEPEESSIERTTVRNRRNKRHRSPSEESLSEEGLEDDNPNNTTVMEDQNPDLDRSFSDSLSSPHDFRSRGRNPLIVPSNMTITANFFVLKGEGSIFLTAFVAQNSPIDLIIGRSSIKKHHFLTSNPSHFVSIETHLKKFCSYNFSKSEKCNAPKWHKTHLSPKRVHQKESHLLR